MFLGQPPTTFFFLFHSGKIVSPKWKSFKGLRLLWRDKIRLNNAIWRAWFIQCKAAALFCPFILFHLSMSDGEAHYVGKETLKEINKRGFISQWGNSVFCVEKMTTFNFLLPLFALFRCGEEEEPSVWVCHTTGRLGGWFTSKARGELFVQANVLWMDSSRCGQLILKKKKRKKESFCCKVCDDVNV